MGNVNLRRQVWGLSTLIGKCVTLECLMIIDALYIYTLYLQSLHNILFLVYEISKSKKLMIKDHDIGSISERLSNTVFTTHVFPIMICFKKKVQ